MEEKKFVEIINNSNSKNEILVKYFGYANKSTYKKLNDFIIENNINVSHLDKKIKYCLNCEKIILVNRNKFCSSSCAATYNNSKRKHSEDTKIKIGKSLSLLNKTKICVNIDDRNKYCLNCKTTLTYKQILRKNNFCSNSCSGKYRYSNSSERKKNSISMKERVKNGLHKGWSTRNIISYPEQFFINILNNNNISFKHNHPVNKRDLGLTDSCNFFLDFYFEDKKIDLEIDGSQHRYRKEHDDARDEILTKNGYNVYRIKWKNINTISGKEYIRNEIDKFLKFYNEIQYGV